MLFLDLPNNENPVTRFLFYRNAASDLIDRSWR
jgi:hypothetical protein